MSTFDQLSPLEQFEWKDKIQDMVDHKGLFLGDETVEDAARRLYEQFILVLWIHFTMDLTIQ